MLETFIHYSSRDLDARECLRQNHALRSYLLEMEPLVTVREGVESVATSTIHANQN
jgi:hypothetical protein